MLTVTLLDIDECVTLDADCDYLDIDECLTVPTVLTLMVALTAPVERDTQEMELFVPVRM